MRAVFNNCGSVRTLIASAVEKLEDYGDLMGVRSISDNTLIFDIFRIPEKTIFGISFAGKGIRRFWDMIHRLMASTTNEFFESLGTNKRIKIENESTFYWSDSDKLAVVGKLATIACEEYVFVRCRKINDRIVAMF